MSNSQGTTTLVRSTNVMQDPTELTKICSSQVIFQCQNWVKSSQKNFLVPNSWLGEQVLLLDFVEKTYF